MRHQGLDIARFVAFSGMVLVNFRIAANVTETGNWAADFTHLLEGRAAALFVVLAGIGISLAHPSPSLMVRRGVFLIVIGLINQTVFEADILHYYGVYFLVAILALRLSPTALVAASGAVILLATMALVLFDYEAGWNWDTLEYSGFWTLSGFIRNLFYNGWHPVFPWLAFLLFGMFLGRLPLGHGPLQILLLVGGICGAIAVTLISIALSFDPELVDLVGLSPIPPGPFYMLAGIASSCAMLGAVLLATPWLARLRLASLMALTGRQSLTLYIAHIFIGMGALETLGYLDSRLSSGEIFAFSVGFIVVCLAYAKLWSMAYSRGPIEMAMRRICG